MPRGLRRFHESPHCIDFSCYRLRPGWRPKGGREPGALPNFVNAAVYELTSFFLPPFRQKRAKGWVPCAKWECGSECTSRWEPPHLCGGRSASALREKLDFDLRFSAGMERSPGY